MTIQKSFQQFKKHFASLFLLEFAFWIILFFFLVFVKNKLLGYITIIQQYAPQLAVISQGLAQNTTTNNEAFAVLTTVENVTKEALFFTYILVPVIIYVLWCMFQGSSWFIMKEKKTAFLSFFGKFALITAGIGVILVLVLRPIVNDALITTPPDTLFVQTILVLFVLLYILTVAYTCLSKESWKQFFTKFLNTSIKQVHRISIPYILFFTISFFAVFLFFSLFLSHTTNKFFLLPPALFILYLALALIVRIFLKVYIQTKTNELMMEKTKK